ncbi:MAG: glycerol-3-phosphate 1-O-acyltransferase PlsY [Candidatus Krumholzibacteriota bacterium]|nr:glycerol-3-phosphate 1-O-acyltransferase PlsY [Candidatus Krumholzibacteriota bacterium]
MDLLLRIAMVVVPSYLIGAIPSSFVVGKLVRGIDLREHGSGNLGAANTFRVLGPGAAVPVLAFDIIKGFIAVRYFSTFGGPGIWYGMLAVLVVVIGHNYSVFIGFSGGKGVGTTAGAFLALAPWAVAFCIGVWIVVLLLSRIVSIASMIASALLPFAVLFENRYLDREGHVAVQLLAVAVTLLILFTHRGNIRRLARGEEKRIF